MRIATWGVIVGLALIGCGDEGSATLIGATCEKSSECDALGVCITDGKDGLCSLPCNNAGVPGECPQGSYCDRGTYTTDDSAQEQTLCLPACTSKSDCRDGYECNGLSSGPGKVCQPK